MIAKSHPVRRQTWVRSSTDRSTLTLGDIMIRIRKDHLQLKGEAV